MTASTEQLWTLIQAYQDGDNQALGEVMQLYKGKLQTEALKYVKNPRDAEDALQDVTLNLLKIPPEDRASKFQVTAKNILPFLKRQVKHKSIDLYRRAKRMIGMEELFDHQSL